MSARRGSWNALIALAAMAALVAHHGAAAPPSTPPVIGLAQNTPAVYALTNVRIISEPGKLIEKMKLGKKVEKKLFYKNAEEWLGKQER